MSLSKKHIVVYLYYSLRDPLCEGLMLSYLKSLKNAQFVFHLITFEQQKYALSSEQSEIERQNLENEFNIHWHPIPYKSGHLFLLKKLISALRAILISIKIRTNHKIDLISAMATPVGTYAYIASRLLRIPFCQFTYEPHALIMMQSGRLSSKSIKYKLARWFENRIGKRAEYVVCTTRHMVEDLKLQNAKGKLIRLPTSVDENQNQFNAHARKEIRNELQIEDKNVLIYPGKFGGMYRTKSTIELISYWLKQSTNNHAIIISDFDINEIEKWIQECGISKSRITILTAMPLHALGRYLSAADVGLIAYENFDSRKYCSPVKTGEYLMSGLPIMVQRGTSEDDEVAEQNNVGVILESFDESGLKELSNKLNALLKEEKSTLRARCRSVGEKYRGKQNAIRTMREIFENC